MPADLILAARSRRRHRLPDEGAPRRPRLLPLSAADVAAHLRHSVSGAWDEDGEARQLADARRIKFANWLAWSGIISEDTHHD